ncbi:MAG: chloride channel protein [Oscillospiraceae bacterium]
MRAENFWKETKEYGLSFLKWVFAGLAIGLIGGLVGAVFHEAVEYATAIRKSHDWLIWLMPVGGLVIVAAYRSCKMVLDTNIVIRAIHTKNRIHWVMAPLIFVGTVISHLVGASVGREGAALQIGGVIGSQFSRICHLDEWDRHVVIMCGMSAVFAANFGTPVTAAFFALEITSVGIVYYAGLVPCLVASLTATAVAGAIGVEPFGFGLLSVPEIGAANLGLTALLGVLCALLSIVFCRCLHAGEHMAKTYIKNDFLRILAGAAGALLLGWLAGPGRYNGAGMDVIYDAVAGVGRPEDFLIKMAMTVLCVAVGFKGGEIIPTLFIGSSFGCLMGSLLGMDPGFAAALCMIALFCGMVNCPVASIILSIELFGSQGLPFFVLACAVSLMLSGNYSLYREQSIVYSKIKAQYINQHSR